MSERQSSAFKSVSLRLLEIFLDKPRLNGYSIPVAQVGYRMDDTSSSLDIDLDHQQSKLRSPQVH
jgi:hypothetical protein